MARTVVELDGRYRLGASTAQPPSGPMELRVNGFCKAPGRGQADHFLVTHTGSGTSWYIEAEEVVLQSGDGIYLGEYSVEAIGESLAEPEPGPPSWGKGLFEIGDRTAEEAEAGGTAVRRACVLITDNWSTEDYTWATQGTQLKVLVRDSVSQAPLGCAQVQVIWTTAANGAGYWMTGEDGRIDVPSWNGNWLSVERVGYSQQVVYNFGEELFVAGGTTEVTIDLVASGGGGGY